MPNYNIEINHRVKKGGGGISEYMHKYLHYRAGKDLQLGGDCNTVFIEILKNSINTKCNLICGCVYRPPFMSLQHFNELLACVLCMLQREKNMCNFNVNTLHKANSGIAKQDRKLLWAIGNCCKQLDLVIPLAHWDIGFRT